MRKQLKRSLTKRQCENHKEISVRKRLRRYEGTVIEKASTGSSSKEGIH